MDSEVASRLNTSHTPQTEFIFPIGEKVYMKNPGMLLKSLSELQKRMAVAQDKLAQTDFDGDAAGGLVKVVVNGKGELKGVAISPAVMDEGSEMVSELVQAAYNVAFVKKEAAAKDVLGSMTAGLMPLGTKLPAIGL